MPYDNIERRNQRRSHAPSRRRQQVKQQLLVIGLTVFAVVIMLSSCIRNHIKKETVQETMRTVVQEEQKETEQERLTRVKKEAEKAGYPDEIIQLLSKNPETVDFVENYGQKKNLPAADTIEEVKKGVVPQLLQWDERWGYAPYGTSTVAVSGCGPTCLSMVITGLTGDASVTPAQIAAYGTENGYINEENDTLWQFMTEAVAHWGVTSYEISVDESSVAAELQAGRPVIASVGPGDFTRNGHFIVLAGYENGNVTVYDPFNQENSEKTWVYADIVGQVKALWAYYYA